MSRQGSAYALAAIAIVFWATVGSVFNLTLRHLEAPELLFFSLPVALAAIAVVVTIERKWGAVAAATRRDLLVSAFAGFINPFLYYNVLFQAYDLLLTQEATTLNFLWPIVLVVLSAIFLGQRLTARSAIALVVGFGGVYVIATRGDLASFRFRDTLGVALAVGSTILWASFWIINLKDRRDPAVKLFWNFAFALAFMTAAWPFAIEPRVPPLAGLAGAVYTGLFEMGITFFVWLTALARARRTADVANLIFLTPFLAMVCIAIFVGERILVSTIAGLALVILGIAIQIRSGPKGAGESDG